MRREDSSVEAGANPDWEDIGYLVSIVSVVFLGAVAWPRPNEPRWHMLALILGMATSIAGMALRYLAHRQQQKEIRKAKAEARAS